MYIVRIRNKSYEELMTLHKKLVARYGQLILLNPNNPYKILLDLWDKAGFQYSPRVCDWADKKGIFSGRDYAFGNVSQ